MIPYLDVASFTYVFADFRGYGASRELTGAYTTDEMVGDVVALADALGWRRFDVVGHSMGGEDRATDRRAPSRARAQRHRINPGAGQRAGGRRPGLAHLRTGDDR
nr:alpha/beta fold hydrolase [Serratia sp. FS14]